METKKLRKKNSSRSGRLTSFATAPVGESPGKQWERTERVGDDKQRVQEAAEVYETKVYLGEKKAHTQKSVILLI